MNSSKIEYDAVSSAERQAIRTLIYSLHQVFAALVHVVIEIHILTRRYLPTTRDAAASMPGVGDYHIERNEPPKGGRLYFAGFNKEYCNCYRMLLAIPAGIIPSPQTHIYCNQNLPNLNFCVYIFVHHRTSCGKGERCLVAKLRPQSTTILRSRMCVY